MSKPGERSLTPQSTKDVFLEQLAKTGNKAVAAARAGWRVRTAYDNITRDPEFARLCDEAIEEFHGEIEMEIYRRGVKGVPKDVWHNGVIVGQETTYSDRLLVELARANIAKYQPKQHVKLEPVVSDENPTRDMSQEERDKLRKLIEDEDGNQDAG